MGKTSPVTALVTSSSGVSAKTSDIKVTVGGCGG
jgi:predicted secreted protein